MLSLFAALVLTRAEYYDVIDTPEWKAYQASLKPAQMMDIAWVVRTVPAKGRERSDGFTLHYMAPSLWSLERRNVSKVIRDGKKGVFFDLGTRTYRDARKDDLQPMAFLRLPQADLPFSTPAATSRLTFSSGRVRGEERVEWTSISSPRASTINTIWQFDVRHALLTEMRVETFGNVPFRGKVVSTIVQFDRSALFSKQDFKIDLTGYDKAKGRN